MSQGFWIAIWSLGLSAVGSVATFAVTMFTKWGDGLLKYKFDQHLEKYKNDMMKEIERLKASLSHLTDRGIRSNQLEYEALTAAWESFVTTHRCTMQCVMRLVEHPDFMTMKDDQVEDYLRTTEFSEPQKKQMMGAKDRNDMYVKIDRLRTINAAGSAIYESHQVIANKGIFIPEDLEVLFFGAVENCSKIWALEKTSFSYGNAAGSAKELIKFNEEAPKLRAALKTAVRNRMLATFPEKAIV